MSQTSTPQKGSRLVLFVIAWAIVSAMVLIGAAIFLFVHFRKNPSRSVVITAPRASPVASDSQPKASSFSKSVSIALAEEESGHGLTLVQGIRDGASTIEQVNGVSARALRLEGKR